MQRSTPWRQSPFYFFRNGLTKINTVWGLTFQLCNIILLSCAVFVKSTPYLIYLSLVKLIPMIQSLGDILYLYYPPEATINDFFFPELMDYPESDEDCGVRAADFASGSAILDTDDMETGNSAPPEASWSLSGAPRRPDVPPAGISGSTSAADRACPSAGSSRRPTSSSAGESQPIDSPDLPPIYRTVKKDREKNMVTHTLLGSGPNRAGCTVYGTSVSQIDPIGSFANAGDKRHNITSHRFDFKNKRSAGKLRRAMSASILPRFLFFRIRISRQCSLRGGMGMVLV
jgi:hypothetical protein